MRRFLVVAATVAVIALAAESASASSQKTWINASGCAYPGFGLVWAQHPATIGVTCDPHDHIVGAENAAQPGTIDEGKIEGGQGSLADNHGMHKLNGNVLGIGRVGAAAEGEQASAAQKTLRHLAAGLGQPRSLACEEALAQAIPFEQSLFNQRREFKAGRHEN